MTLADTPPKAKGGESDADVWERTNALASKIARLHGDAYCKAIHDALTEYGNKRARAARAAGFAAGEAAAVNKALGVLDEEDWLGYSKDRICARIRALAAAPTGAAEPRMPAPTGPA